MIIAALAHGVLPPQEPIELINVCFDPRHESPDRLGAWAGLEELSQCYPSRGWRLLCVDVEMEEVERNKDRIKRLMQPCHTPLDTSIASAFWFAARGVGYLAPSSLSTLTTTKLTDATRSFKRGTKPLLRYANLPDGEEQEDLSVYTKVVGGGSLAERYGVV